MTFILKNHQNLTNDYLSRIKLADYIYLCYKPNDTVKRNKFNSSLYSNCKDGQYIEIRNKLYKLVNSTIKYNKIVYYFENDVVLEIIKTKNNKIIYNLFSLRNLSILFSPQTINFISKKIIKEYSLLSNNGDIEFDLIYNLMKS